MVDRQPLRESSVAWQRATMDDIPMEMKAWVGDITPSSKKNPSEAVTLEPATAGSSA